MQRNKEGYVIEGPIRRMDAPALLSPLGTPKKLWFPIAGLGLVAALIGMFFGFQALDNIVYADERQRDAVQESIMSSAESPVPILLNFCYTPVEEIRTLFEDMGYVFLDVGDQSSDAAEYLDIIRVPVSLDPALSEIAIRQGPSKLSPPEAGTFLAESWRLTAIRNAEAIDYKVKYSVFGPATIQDAISGAMNAQGWQSSTLGESGVDSMGNNYQNGTIEHDGRVYSWSIYACPLNDAYHVLGLPEESYYVSARIQG